MIDNPIRFPSETEVIDEEVARFRALSPEARVQALGEMYALYQFFARDPAHSERIARVEAELRDLERKSVAEFIRRHG